MKGGGGFVVFIVQQIINAGGGIQIFYEILAEKREIDDCIARGIRSGQRGAGEVGENRVTAARILDFKPGENFVLE